MHVVVATTLLLAGLTLLAASILRRTATDWVGFPLQLLLVRATIATAAAPLMTWAFGLTDRDPILVPPQPSELPPALGLLALCYGSIAIGALIVRALGARRSVVPPDTHYSPRERDRAWLGFLCLTAVGLAFAAIIFSYLLRTASVADIARFRYAFHATEAISSPVYNFARYFFFIFELGAWGLVLFARTRGQRWLGFGAAAAHMLSQIAFGGRSRTVLAVLGLALVYHYGVRRLSARRLLAAGAVATLLLAGVAALRIGPGGESGVAGRLVNDFFKARRAYQAAFALEQVPAHMPYLRGTTIVGGLAHTVPGLTLPGAQSLWREIEDRYVGRRLFPGLAGRNYALGAELYMNGGFTAVVVGGLLFGMIFGWAFEWQRLNPGNLFVLIFGVRMCLAFLGGVDSKMPAALSGATITIVPLALAATMAMGVRRSTVMLVVLSSYAVSMGFFYYMEKTFEADPIGKYLTVPLLLCAYVVAFRICHQAGPRHRPPTPAGELACVQ